MEQRSENILVITPGEPIPEGVEGYIKLYLAGSIDINDSSSYNWQEKFIAGLVELTNPLTGLIMLKTQKFLIINPRFAPTNPLPSYQNPEFVTKLTWSMDMMTVADAVILNFLKKSTAPIPMLEFGALLFSEKVVVRCPEEYINYSTVKVLCEKYSIPMYPSNMSAVRDLVQGIYAYIPKFKELQKHQLPE